MVEVTEKWGGVDEARLFSFSSHSDKLRAQVTNYGAALVSLQVKTASGDYQQTTLGYDTIQEWMAGTNYFGCTVGRYGNRIKEGKFSIDGKEYTLPDCNNGPNHLHGGVRAYDKTFWASEPIETPQARGVKLTLTSPDGDHGYPGTLHITTWVMLSTDDEILFKWRAHVDETKTIVNLTNHSYWNLGNWPASAPLKVLNHKLTVRADRYVPVDATSIPTGELPSVSGTPFDFTEGRVIGDDVDHALLEGTRGYDHTLAFAAYDVSAAQPEAEAGGWSAGLPHQATLECEQTGVSFKLFTSEPGVQVYSGNYLSGTQTGYDGAPIAQRGAVCLECQHYPDSPNQPTFPSVVLAPGEVYNHTTVHKFFVK